ncbi:MAG: aldolase [Candidatus Solibacter sp.]
MREVVLSKRMDPLGCDQELGFTGTYYPAGFGLRIVTNSREVLEAAEESWGPVERQFDTPPMAFRVVVEAAGEGAGEPTCRKQGHLISLVADAHNFASGDCITLSASLHVAQATVGDRAAFRWYFLEAMAYMLLTQRYVIPVHAGCVARGGAGILLCGKSAAGKSTLSVACARAGFTYLSDDCTWLLAGEDRIAIGKPHQARFREDVARHFPELEGYVARRRPNGKRSIEVPTSLFPAMRTAKQCEVRGLVFLDRARGGEATVERMPAQEVEELLLAELPSFGAEVNALHEAAVRRLGELPAWRVCYGELGDAIRILRELPLEP